MIQKLERMIFLHGRDTLLGTNLPANNQSISLCRDADLSQVLPLSNVVLATGYSPFDVSPKAHCVATISRNPRVGEGWDLSRKAGACSFAIDTEDGEIRRFWTTLQANDNESIRRCVYRTALFFQGYNGVLEMSDEDLFISTSKTTLFSSQVGEWVPDLAWQLSICSFAVPSDIHRGQMNKLNPCKGNR
jgi:hypothetical protein